MGFRGIVGWLRGRGRKEEEEEDPNVSLASRIMEKEMMRNIEEFLTYDPPKLIMRKRRIHKFDVPDETWDRIKDERFPKEINGKKYVFSVIRLQNPSYRKWGEKYFVCSKCRRSFEGAIFGYKKDGKLMILDIICFSKLPDYVDPVKSEKELNQWR